jgi:hypothetical protein
MERGRSQDHVTRGVVRSWNKEGVGQIMERGRSQDHVTRGGVRSWNEEGVRVVESGRSQDHRQRKESGPWNEEGVRLIETVRSQDHRKWEGVRLIYKRGLVRIEKGRGIQYQYHRWREGARITE